MKTSIFALVKKFIYLRRQLILKKYTIIYFILWVSIYGCRPTKTYIHNDESKQEVKIEAEEPTQKETPTPKNISDPYKDFELPAIDRDDQILRRTGYTVCYNADNRLPDWVAWRLTADHTTGEYKRGGIKFQEDEEVEEPRATDSDYRQSGYDRGHLCPSGDNKWSQKAQQESFLLTNVCPQAHNLNAGDWNEMEQQCRQWARKYGEIFIVCGPILYNQKHKKIGTHKVVVPEAFFKVVLCMSGMPKAIGFIYKNADGNRPKGDYVNTVDQVERITGYDFFANLPDDVEKRVEATANLAEW